MQMACGRLITVKLLYYKHEIIVPAGIHDSTPIPASIKASKKLTIHDRFEDKPA
jgi:hypothetical protein